LPTSRFHDGHKLEEKGLLNLAAYYATEKQVISISFLQHHIKIGFQRAAHLISVLVQKGVISQPKPHGPWVAMITWEEYLQRMTEQLMKA